MLINSIQLNLNKMECSYKQFIFHIKNEIKSKGYSTLNRWSTWLEIFVLTNGTFILDFYQYIYIFKSKLLLNIQVKNGNMTVQNFILFLSIDIIFIILL